MTKSPMVSVYMLVFNHSKYLREAIDSVLMQKTNFDYEIIVGDDASTDESAQIIKEYEEKYPEKIKAVIRDENLFGNDIDNFVDLRRRCSGKYMIALEGDDFWTDENKLQKQVDFLEENEDYIAVAHHTLVVDTDSNPTGEKYPECDEEEYSIKHFASEIMPGQLTTIMHRNIYINDKYDVSCFERPVIKADRLQNFFLINHGKIKCLKETMSAYRHIKDGGDSFSANHSYDFDMENHLCEGFLDIAKNTNDEETIIIAEMLYYKNLLLGRRTKQCSKEDFKKYLEKIDNKRAVKRLYSKQWINHHIFKKKLWI